MKAFEWGNNTTHNTYKIAIFYNEIYVFIGIYHCENKNVR